MKFKILIIAVQLVFFIQLNAQNTGVIEGRVFNSKNNEAVGFASIGVFGTSIGSISDLDGNFLFTGLTPGYVELRVSSIGFDTYVSEPILVTNARKVFIDIPLQEAQILLEEVSVKASPFRRDVESPVSMRRISLVEIEKNPGGNRDISKVIQSYPGVASTPSFRNDVVVRGGGASENSFYLDGVEIPNINHFATQGASGGPVGIINVDFLREVNFYSGAFPANRGNALSSVIEFKQIDGNKEKLKFKGSVGASDLALTFDGPIGEKTTYIVSARRSYLQLLFSAIGLPFLPTYNDFQFKVRTRLDEKNEITFIGLGAIDQFRLNLDANETEEQRYILGYLPVNEQWSYTVGAVYKHFRESGYDTWVLSRNKLNNISYKYYGNDEDSIKSFDYDSYETETKFRYEHFSQYSSGIRLNVGGGLEYSNYSNYTFREVLINGNLLSQNYTSKLDLIKWDAFAQMTKSVLDERLTLSLGARFDATNYSKETSNVLDQFSPRFSASYRLSQYVFLNFNMGRYYQLPSYTTLGFRNATGDLVNKDMGLKFIRADHIVAGIEIIPDEKSRFTIEGFYKHYHNYPYSVVDSVSISSKGADFGTYGDEEVLSIAEGRAFGTEFLYRNRDLLGMNITMSYSLVRSEAEAFRSAILSQGKWTETAWDNRHLINILILKEMKKNWSIGGRWRYVGGVPYTPYDEVQSSLVKQWDVRGMGILDYNRFNQERLKAFHQLDLRIDKEFFLKNISMNFYIDIQNVYNFKADQQSILVLDEDSPTPILNPTDPSDQWNYDLKNLAIQGGTVLPTVGIIIQF
ncbi:MAG: TonB-dependent receptor [Bacteroidales bacterium]|nr:TonB-dependent receptor [Bacteroidales bacterium]MCF8390688.1 TonB-dependent receptor [Bacteroidales bacterium]